MVILVVEGYCVDVVEDALSGDVSGGLASLLVRAVVSELEKEEAVSAGPMATVRRSGSW